ncbi:MAG TPA: enoyl-CoA hydratase-related protein [Allosphingosinicella sp.]
MADEILATPSGAILELRLNRPEKKNAITAAMYAALADALTEAANDPRIRVVTILGRDGIFSSGNDLRDFQQSPPLDTNQPVFRFLSAISNFPKILVAGVEGAAVGVGTTMLLHCDLVLAAPSAMFSMPFVDLGLVPEAASSLLLPQLIGPQRAAKHLLLGDPFDAETALRYGLVTDIVIGDLEARVRNIAEAIAAKPPEAVRITKRLIRSNQAEVQARVDEEAALFAGRLTSAEAAEAFAAFFERRAPNFG